VFDGTIIILFRYLDSTNKFHKNSFVFNSRLLTCRVNSQMANYWNNNNSCAFYMFRCLYGHFQGGIQKGIQIQQILWHSEDRASWYILIIKPTRCTISQIYFWNRTVHFTDSSSTHHQESSTVHTAISMCHTGYADCLLADHKLWTSN